MVAASVSVAAAMVEDVLKVVLREHRLRFALCSAVSVARRTCWVCCRSGISLQLYDL
jgi:hypothetical protein